MTDLVALRALAEQATPTNWHVIGTGVSSDHGAGWVDWICEETNQGPQDAAFIAACDPGTVLSLVAALEAALVVDDAAEITADDAHLEHALVLLRAALAPFREQT